MPSIKKNKTRRASSRGKRSNHQTFEQQIVLSFLQMLNTVKLFHLQLIKLQMNYIAV